MGLDPAMVAQPSDIHLGYCTNVHAGASYAEMLENLGRYATRVKELFSPREPMGIGLWLSAASARSVASDPDHLGLKGWLAERGLYVFTINGFPYGDFHGKSVQYRVYQPTWAEPARLDYTRDLVAILTRLLPPGAEGSISTLPVAWGTDVGAAVPAARQLRQLADDLARHEEATGTLIHVDLEPEPGCVLSAANDVVRFFQDVLLPEGNEERLRKYLRVSHDMCHSAVLFEDQAEVLDGYRKAGIRVGKVQVSSAIRAEGSAIAELHRFDEPRYLHQTVVSSPGCDREFFDNLKDALANPRVTRAAASEWRVHFHVPVFLEHIGALATTQAAIRECLSAIRPEDGVRHYEVETYAWNVLPGGAAEADLAAGIARELAWARQAMGTP